VKHLFVIDGKGRCEGARAYVLSETLAGAVARLLRADACPYFDVKEVVTFVVERTNSPSPTKEEP
jgi:hypothetical protein